MRIVIVEDEIMVAKRLRRFVDTSLAEKLTSLRQFSTLDDAQEHLSQNSIDLLFLDLNLRGQDGFELLKEQVSKSFQTIVVSANTDRAIEAFDIGVLDFVAKPFTQDRIDKALDRAMGNPTGGKCKFVSYKSMGKLALLPVDNIAFLQASGHYCEIITSDEQTVLHDKSLDKLLAVLPEHFVRIHRSFATSLNNIQSLRVEQGSRYFLELRSGQELPVGRTRYQELKSLIG